MFKRTLSLPSHPKRSFFLWGPRQAGKSSLLREIYPNALRYDLLKTDIYVQLHQQPQRLREDLLAQPPAIFVIIDEVQKVPQLLDEVHWLIENHKSLFALCGSSARKLRRGHANLLGGRALRYELFGLVSAELGEQFDLVKLLNRGYLPSHYLEEDDAPLLIRSYINDYLKEEIAAEGLIRSLPTFSTFLNIAAISDTELINYSTIARECGVSSPAVKEYFQIIIDTLLGAYLPAYTKRPKRRVIQAPKFYFADVGVVNQLAKRGEIQPRSELFGKAFENWVFHELNAHRSYTKQFYELSYWRTSNGAEVDFIINDMETAIEAKASSNITSDHLKGLREIKKDYPKIKNRFLVSLEARERKTEDGIHILPYNAFVERLWANEF